MNTIKKAPGNVAINPAQVLAATNNKMIIAQKTIKLKRRKYRLTIEKTRLNQALTAVAVVLGVFAAYWILAYLLGAPGDMELRIGG